MLGTCYHEHFELLWQVAFSFLCKDSTQIRTCVVDAPLSRVGCVYILSYSLADGHDNNS